MSVETSFIGEAAEEGLRRHIRRLELDLAESKAAHVETTKQLGEANAAVARIVTERDLFRRQLDERTTVAEDELESLRERAERAESVACATEFDFERFRDWSWRRFVSMRRGLSRAVNRMGQELGRVRASAHLEYARVWQIRRVDSVAWSAEVESLKRKLAETEKAAADIRRKNEDLVTEVGLLKEAYATAYTEGETDEREACAKVAEGHHDPDAPPADTYNGDWNNCAEHIASAIRARSKMEAPADGSKASGESAASSGPAGSSVAGQEPSPKPHVMDATDGPVCACGKPSTHESGWCGGPCSVWNGAQVVEQADRAEAAEANLNGMTKAHGYERQLREAAEKKLAEVQAQAAAMRRALETILSQGIDSHWLEGGRHMHLSTVVREALSSPAGRDLVVMTREEVERVLKVPLSERTRALLESKLKGGG